MRLRPTTLRGQLALAFVIVALLPAGVLAFSVAWSAQRALRLSAFDHNGQLAATVAAEIARHLEGQVLHLQGVEYAVEAWQARGERTGLPPAPHVARNPATQAVLLLDLQGRVVGVDPPDRDLQGIDLSRLPFLAAARRSGRPTWSSVTLSPRTGRPSIALALPSPTRTLVEYVDLAVLREIVLRVRSQRQAELLVMDGAGTVLGAEDERLVRERESLGELPLVRQALAGRLGTDEVVLDGRRQLASAAPVPLTGWAVVAAQPADEAFALVTRIRSYVVAAFVLAALAATAMAASLSRRIRRPIDALAGAVRAVAGGRYDLALPRGALVEIDALATSFATMASAIDERERARREADRHYRNVVSTPLVAVVRTNPDGRVIFCNEAAARLAGWPSALAAAGHEVAELFVEPAEWGRLQAALRRGDRVVNRELLLRRPDRGRPVEVLANAVAADDELTLLMLDVSEERQAAAELERLEQALQTAQRLEALGRLAGGIAHDFNNLLTVIIGLATELEETLAPEEAAHEAVEGILMAARRGSRLTQSLLAYGRKQALRPRPSDLRQVLAEATQLARRVIGEQVALTVELPEAPVPASVDPGQLEQVLLNLCTNARDAMPGGGQLTVALTTEEIAPEQAADWGLQRAGHYARIEVRDTGQGMSPEVRARIFEPFFTTKQMGKGSGLGLAIVYGIVRQHEGHVQVRSTPGEGTVISVLLPLGPGLPAVAPAPPAPEPAQVEAGRGIILLADDEVLVRRVMRSILEHGGYHVVEAVDGEQAIAAFAAQPDLIDLCVFDVAMPRLNGLEARARVRALRPGLPVLLVSGYATDVLDSAGPGDDVPELMGKPVVPQELLAKVRELLERARAAAPGPRKDGEAARADASS
jgi:PAS domain S-box-containing protein